MYPSTLSNIKCPLLICYMITPMISEAHIRCHAHRCLSIVLTFYWLISQACVMDFPACVLWFLIGHGLLPVVN
jgi:hypothetical protein